MQKASNVEISLVEISSIWLSKKSLLDLDNLSCNLCLSSKLALLVKVTTSSFFKLVVPLSIILQTFSISTLVLPLPADAETNKLPTLCFKTSCCAGVNELFAIKSP